MLYLFTLDKVFRYASGIDLSNRLIVDNVTFGKESKRGWWLQINTQGLVVINKGYSWDGCSPKILIAGKVVGTPDGQLDSVTRLPQTHNASLVHDALCQFAEDPKMPFTRAEIDLMFHSILKQNNFKYADVYYKAVRGFVVARDLLRRVRGVFS